VFGIESLIAHRNVVSATMLSYCLAFSQPSAQQKKGPSPFGERLAQQEVLNKQHRIVSERFLLAVAVLRSENSLDTASATNAKSHPAHARS
jgi:hypothetical protein